jgi:hypothetical protein
LRKSSLRTIKLLKILLEELKVKLPLKERKVGISGVNKRRKNAKVFQR